MKEQISLNTIIPESLSGLRVDLALAKCFPDYSRAQLTEWVKDGSVLVNTKKWRPKNKVVGGENVAIQAEQLVLVHEAEDIPLDIVYEDEHILVINKSADCVVHPGAGNWEGTLLNALLHHCEGQKHLPRAGIIHRLDKDTTGLMVVTKSQLAYTKLVADLSERKIGRYYYAVARGRILSGGTIDLPIGRHSHNRLKMAVVKNGKHARTHYRVAQRFSGYTLLDIKLETGRTHQIRVHLSHEKHALIGDTRYAGRAQLMANLNPSLRECIQKFTRPALHAYHLRLEHPFTHQPMEWSLPIPDDMQALLKELEKNESDKTGRASPFLGAGLHDHSGAAR